MLSAGEDRDDDGGSDRHCGGCDWPSLALCAEGRASAVDGVRESLVDSGDDGGVVHGGVGQYFQKAAVSSASRVMV